MPVPVARFDRMKPPTKPAPRRATAKKPAAKRALPSNVQTEVARYGFEVSPVTGLPVKPLTHRKRPISSEVLKAALENAL